MNVKIGSSCDGSSTRPCIRYSRGSVSNCPIHTNELFSSESTILVQIRDSVELGSYFYFRNYLSGLLNLLNKPIGKLFYIALI